MAQNVITLYDIPSTTPQPWAPNIWRIRFILNYKRLPYRTVWIEFSDVETTLRTIGALPTSMRADGRPVYSLPVIIDPLGPNTAPKVLSRVDKIVEYLESTYPARPIFPEGSRALQSLFVHYVHEVLMKPLLPILVPLSHQRLPERSQAHFSYASGQPQLGPQEREQAWRAAQEQFSFLASIMDKNHGDLTADGVVVMGRNVSYADFALCSVLIWIEQVAPRDGWARMRVWNDGRWDKLQARCREYMDVY
ncbi:hypothetical protein BDW22DRAFT_1406933 [Trametopsis cervina]|nr:hypothetical protein BDW22DRAFT_1406933 [Trametopsis cervina]